MAPLIFRKGIKTVLKLSLKIVSDVRTISLGVFFSLGSCTITSDVALTFSERIVLNSLLTPDSVIRVDLSLSNGSIEKLTPIANATVTITENSARTVQLSHQGGGVYKTEEKPKMGFHYKVVATVPGKGQVEAEDVLPLAPVVSACFFQSGAAGGYNAMVRLSVSRSEVESALWNDFLIDDYGDPRDFTSINRMKPFYLKSNDPLVDPFNAIYDPGLNPAEGNFQHTLYIRHSDQTKSLDHYTIQKGRHSV